MVLIKGEPTSKPTSSRLGTCQYENLYILAHWSLFWNHCLQMWAASPSHHLHSPFSGNHQSFVLNKIITCIFIGWLPWLNATGHYLSATALMWVTTRNVALREKMTYLVNSLKECQKSIGTGYLSAFPSEFFDRFEAVQPVWAPYYTIHKVRTAQDLLYSSSQPRVLNILME